MWTPDALASECCPYRGEAWRVVEAHGNSAAGRLTDTLEEQAILRAILERDEATLPLDGSGSGDDDPPAAMSEDSSQPSGSRFRRAGQPERAVYVAETVHTAIAEAAFYRLLFFAESPGTTLPSRPTEHMALRLPCTCARHLDLTRPPFDRDETRWTAPADYTACQELADAARVAAVELLRYRSVRDPACGANLALLSEQAFATAQPVERQNWQIFVSRYAVRAWCEEPEQALEFPIRVFAADPRLSGLADT